MNLHLANIENSQWIFRDIINDFIANTRHKLVGYTQAQAIWFLNPWSFMKLQERIPHFLSIHHIDESKLKEWNFNYISRFASGCFVPNLFTLSSVKKYINIPTYIFPYWLKSGICHVNKQKVNDLKKNLSPNGEILIGSFQKDSEGSSNFPKLSKGPDRFLNIVNKLKDKYKVKVILSGHSRGYIIEGLRNCGIPYKYFEMADDINSLYACIDWYFVTSRFEGGPQAVLEASFHNTKILSYDVGIASNVLHPFCLCYDDNDFINKLESKKYSKDILLYNYNSVVENFNCGNIVEKIDLFFDQYIEGNKGNKGNKGSNL